MRGLAYSLYAVGVIVNGIAGVTSALAPTDNWGMSPFLAWTLPSFLRGGIDAWWLSYVREYWPVPATLIIAVALALPLYSDLLLSGGEGRRERAPGGAPPSTLSPNSASGAAST